MVQGINMSLTAGANIPTYLSTPHIPTKPSSCGIKRGMREVQDGWSRVHLQLSFCVRRFLGILRKSVRYLSITFIRLTTILLYLSSKLRKRKLASQKRIALYLWLKIFRKTFLRKRAKFITLDLPTKLSMICL